MWHLAQLNVARAIAPLDSPTLAPFVAALDRINALAEASASFVWRLVGDGGDATSIRVDDPDVIVNMSVWQSVEALFDFTYRSGHVEIMRRRREWFAAGDAPYMVLWWIAAGHVPTLAEALERLEHLRVHGPTAHAFSFKRRFAAPDDLAAPVDLDPERHCS
jgi:hypothetical protein